MKGIAEFNSKRMNYVKNLKLYIKHMKRKTVHSTEGFITARE